MIRLSRVPTSLAQFLVCLAMVGGIKAANMFATTSESANTNTFCVWPNQATVKQREPDDAELVARLKARDETAFR